MNRVITKILVLSLSTLFWNNGFAQSTSVFDATYFNQGNTTPPIRAGKGFHINDIYKQTRGCFTSESCKEENLVPLQSGGKKTTLKIYHTKTNEEYHTLIKVGRSGKVGFLNLFSVGGQKLEEYANKEVHNFERLVFNANVDFGTYEFTNELSLTEEAKALIEKKNLTDFVKYYGTHYISGVKRESSISVILTKQFDKSENTTTNSNSTGVGATSPNGLFGSLEVTDYSSVNEQLSNGKFSAVVEINGPAIEQSSIQGQINKILNGNSTDKASAISSLIEGALKGISDPKQSVITQYYYAPFDLFGLEGIKWDEKKQNQLSKINESVIKVYAAQSLLGELTTESGKEQMKQELINIGVSEVSIPKFMEKFDKAVPNFKLLKTKADKYLTELEARYIKCSDVYCANPGLCCNNDVFLAEIEKFNLDSKINEETDKLTKGMEEVAKEEFKPECEKKKQGKITIINYSANPYSLYQGDKFLRTISGKETITYDVNIGVYKFKAVQDSGYLMYATVNHRTANVQVVCEDVILKIGFEDK